MVLKYTVSYNSSITLLTSLQSFFLKVVENKKPGTKYCLKIC